MPGLTYFTAIVVLNNTVFISTDNKGVFASKDNGSTWKLINNGLESLKVQTLAKSGTTLLAGTKSGIFISTDEGENWKYAPTGEDPIKINSFVVDGSTIYAGGNGWSIEFYESANNGVSWTRKGKGLKSNTLSALGVVGNSLFAGTVITGMNVSEDKGVTWKEVNFGLDNADVRSIITKGDSIIIGTNKGIFISTNKGNRWTDMDKALSEYKASQVSNVKSSNTISASANTTTPKDELLSILNERVNEFSSQLGTIETTDGNLKFYKATKTLKSSKSYIKEVNENNSSKKMLVYFYDYKNDNNGALNGVAYMNALLDIINARAKLGMYTGKEYKNAEGRAVTEMNDPQGNKVLEITSNGEWGLQFAFYSKNWGNPNSKPKSALVYESFADPRDGNLYKTVKIGHDVWMAENLNYNAPGSLCFNNDTANCTIYGKLYTWDQAMNSCPAGWHLPSNEEWMKVTNPLGFKEHAGKRMKEADLKHWAEPNFGATNEVGFTALPGGTFAPEDEKFYNLKHEGWWWTSSFEADNVNSAWNRVLFYHKPEIFSDTFKKSYGMSVRCVKDVK